MSAIHEWLDLGDGLRAFYARPQGQGPYPAVLVFIEAFGVNAHFQDVAHRLAKEGFCAIVPDIYHGKVYDYTDLHDAIAHLKTLVDDRVMIETGKALDALQGRPEVDANHIGILGFCMGGRYAFLANAVHADRPKATIAFYGGGIAPEKDVVGRAPLLAHVPAMKAPLLLLYGAKDHSILPDEHGRIAQALSTANKRYTLTVFPDAGHGFFSDRRDSYHPGAAAEAWDLALAHFRRHLT